MKTVFVGNLSYDVEGQDLIDFFESLGKIVHVKVIKDRDTGRSKGYGFVEFEEDKGQEAIDKLSGEELMGRKIVVSSAHRENSFKGKNPNKNEEKTKKTWW